MDNSELTKFRVEWILEMTGDMPDAEDLEMQTLYRWEVKKDGIE